MAVHERARCTGEVLYRTVLHRGVETGGSACRRAEEGEWFKSRVRLPQFVVHMLLCGAAVDCNEVCESVQAR